MNRLVIPALVLAAAACSPGNDQGADTRAPGASETRTYELKDFDRVVVKTGVEVTLKQGPFAVEARSRDGDLSKLVVDVRGSELSIGREVTVGRVETAPNYSVTVTAPSWTSIEGLAGVEIDGENLKLDIVNVEAAAGANIELSGTCREIIAEASAGSEIDADELKCAAAAANATAGSRIELSASERAKGKASAGATIEFSGKPPAFEQEADISSTVKLD